jgi:hypothetical protein
MRPEYPNGHGLGVNRIGRIRVSVGTIRPIWSVVLLQTKHPPPVSSLSVVRPDHRVTDYPPRPKPLASPGVGRVNPLFPDVGKDVDGFKPHDFDFASQTFIVGHAVLPFCTRIESNTRNTTPPACQVAFAEFVDHIGLVVFEDDQIHDFISGSECGK